MLTDYVSNTTSRLSMMSGLNSSGTSRATPLFGSSGINGQTVRINDHIGELSRVSFNPQDGI